VLTIAYLANRFPSAVEPYVEEEIAELRRRGVQVIAGSVWRATAGDQSSSVQRNYETITLCPLGFMVALQAAWLCLRHCARISDLVVRILFRGTESPLRRLKAFVHTWMGACYAVRLREYEVSHIHVHHGYFGSWVAMAAARLLGVGFSMTLHGSDVLLHGAYLDKKIESCTFCATISEYNRRHLLNRYPAADAQKIIVSRLGVDTLSFAGRFTEEMNPRANKPLTLLAVGRLHTIKDHAFLLRACRQLRVRGIAFECSIAGDGPERRKLEKLIRKYGLEKCVTLLGLVAREQMDSLYRRADVVVLTSRSEGIPLVLMEAMARGKIVLAPSITGIPELVIAGKTGFTYEPGSLGDFIARLLFIHSFSQAEEQSARRACVLSAAKSLDWVRYGARVQVRNNFNRRKNLESFGDLLVQCVSAPAVPIPHEDLILQQI
jgi:colanic acid/amylovoran biosynthesis glycosyltransferase